MGASPPLRGVGGVLLLRGESSGVKLGGESMEWYRMDEAKVDWDEESVGVLWNQVEVLAVWMTAPWDAERPWRWGVVLEGDTFPLGPSPEAHIWVAWGTAAGWFEAMESAVEVARALLRALPREWVRVWGDDLP